MKDKILYFLLFSWVKIHAILPMFILYFLSDILYFFIYHITRYRRKVVRSNLINSFSEKTEKDIIILERRFYHHFTDHLVETIKLAHISQEELLNRMNVRNPEVVLDLLDKGQTCLIASLGHYCNWEWLSGVAPSFDDRVILYHIYRPLKNAAFNRLFTYFRTRFNSVGIKKNEAKQDMIALKNDKTPSFTCFIADQTPSKEKLQYWKTFLNQDSAILTGQERVAKSLDIPVVFVDMIKVKRGYYTVDLILITDKPKETPDYYITDKYVELMEKSILRDPAYWLWTHKRWKHKRMEDGKWREESVNSTEM